ncbi:MAG TPA: class I SAM-dependent methyltransferase [Cyclobacteriaceae bacterium]|nr:class I SAM-dependent methyltransferase [Cyclobacteriaceae bacterium]
MPTFFQIKSYLNHWLHVVDEHSIHSPFFFEFYEKVIRDKKPMRGFEEIENVRTKLLQSTMEIDVQDLGARSPHFTSEKRLLSKVAATSISPPPLCELLYRIVRHQVAKSIVELGTSAGITTLYLGKDLQAQVVTFEGNPDLVNIALTHFELFESRNIRLIPGNLDSTLPDFLQNPAKINFALMDANHRYEPTMRYFTLLSKRMSEKGIIVLDDIYHSEEMARAWQELSHHDLVYGSVDLFRCGILFFDTALHRQHYTWSM